MDFINHTRYPAQLFRSMHGDTKIIASVAVRITFDIAGDELYPAEEQPWIVSPGPWDSPYGKFRGDEMYYREGTDLFVFGSARAPGGRPTTKMDVSVTLGDKFKHTIAVMGDRTWEKRGKEIVMTAPKLFTEIPLTLANAFGGNDEWDELPVPFSMNPDGKGFRQFEDHVPGTPLPNIENPKQLIKTWEDYPDPVGITLPPIGFGPRIFKSVEYDALTGEIKKIKATFFNQAFPDMIAPIATPGQKLTVTGMRANGPVSFLIPKTPLSIRTAFDTDEDRKSPHIDQIGVEIDANRVFISYRFPFKYYLVALQKRVCELFPVN